MMSDNKKTDELFCIKVPTRQTEAVKKELIRMGLFLKNYRLLKEDQYIYLPIVSYLNLPTSWVVEKRTFKKIEKIFDYHTILEDILPKILHQYIPTSFDRLGECVLIKLNPALFPQ